LPPGSKHFTRQEAVDMEEVPKGGGEEEQVGRLLESAAAKVESLSGREALAKAYTDIAAETPLAVPPPPSETSLTPSTTSVMITSEREKEQREAEARQSTAGAAGSPDMDIGDTRVQRGSRGGKEEAFTPSEAAKAHGLLGQHSYIGGSVTDQMMASSITPVISSAIKPLM